MDAATSGKNSTLEEETGIEDEDKRRLDGQPGKVGVAGIQQEIVFGADDGGGDFQDGGPLAGEPSVAEGLLGAGILREVGRGFDGDVVRDGCFDLEEAVGEDSAVKVDEVLKDRHKIAEIENDDTVSQATIVETIANTNVNTGKEA